MTTPEQSKNGWPLNTYSAFALLALFTMLLGGAFAENAKPMGIFFIAAGAWMMAFACTAQICRTIKELSNG